LAAAGWHAWRPINRSWTGASENDRSISQLKWQARPMSFWFYAVHTLSIGTETKKLSSIFTLVSSGPLCSPHSAS